MPDPGSLSPQEAADYIAALLGGLQRIADNARLHSLSYVLGLAIKEAKGQKVQQG